jgi:hypothetical protein
MRKERDFMPWVLGGLSAATIAAALAAVSSHRTATTLKPAATPVVAAQSPASPAAAPAPPTIQATSPATPAESESQASSPAAPMQPAVQPAVSGGQIWACTTRGVKTFSNNPCGENSTLLDVGPINTMRATPAIHYVRPYGSASGGAPAYADQGSADDSDDYADQYPAEAGANSYTIVQGVRFVRRRRPDHFHRPPAHHNAAQHPAHNSTPARRN